MRAVLCDRFEGIGALRMGETAEPIPAADEILIDVHAASVSYMDYLMASGGYQMRPTPLCAGNGKRHDLKDRHKLLDVGGGSGVYSIAFCAAYPHLKATILDFPETVDTARLYAGEAGLSNRISHLAGNAIKVEWPKGHDVVLMS
jgi:ribosomal protein L11 methylase PrmA